LWWPWAAWTWTTPRPTWRRVRSASGWAAGCWTGRRCGTGTTRASRRAPANSRGRPVSEAGPGAGEPPGSIEGAGCCRGDEAGADVAEAGADRLRMRKAYGHTVRWKRESGVPQTFCGHEVRQRVRRLSEIAFTGGPDTLLRTGCPLKFEGACFSATCGLDVR